MKKIALEPGMLLLDPGDATQTPTVYAVVSKKTIVAHHGGMSEKATLREGYVPPGWKVITNAPLARLLVNGEPLVLDSEEKRSLRDALGYYELSDFGHGEMRPLDAEMTEHRQNIRKVRDALQRLIDRENEEEMQRELDREHAAG